MDHDKVDIKINAGSIGTVHINGHKISSVYKVTFNAEAGDHTTVLLECHLCEVDVQAEVDDITVKEYHQEPNENGIVDVTPIDSEYRQYEKRS